MTDQVDLTDPARVMWTLADLERQLATKQVAYEEAASVWFAAQREMGKARATALLTSAKGSVTEKKAEGELAAYGVEGAEYEPVFEALKAVKDMIDKRAMICMAILKAQGRA